MKNCYICGTPMEDNDLICPICGSDQRYNTSKEDAELIGRMRQQQPVQQYVPQQPMQQYMPQQPVQQYMPQQPMQQYMPQQPVQQYMPQQPVQQFTPQMSYQQSMNQQPMNQPVQAAVPVMIPATQHMGVSPIPVYQQPTPQAVPQQPTPQAVPQKPITPKEAQSSMIQQGVHQLAEMQQESVAKVNAEVNVTSKMNAETGTAKPAAMEGTSKADNGMPKYQYMKLDPEYVPEKKYEEIPKKKSVAPLIIGIAAGVTVLVALSVLLLTVIFGTNKNLDGGALSENELTNKLVTAINDNNVKEYLKLIPDDLETDEVVDSANDLFDFIEDSGLTVDTFESSVDYMDNLETRNFRAAIKDYTAGKITIDKGAYLFLEYEGTSENGNSFSGNVKIKIIKVNEKLFIADIEY